MNRFHKMVLTVFSVFVLEVLFIAFVPLLRMPVLVLLLLEVLGLILLWKVRNREKRGNIARDVMNGRRIRLGEGNVRYKFTGNPEDPVVVMINGFPMPYEIWDRNVEALSARHFSVLQFDLWGFGYSDRPKTSYDTDLYCRQIQQLVKKLGLDQRPIHIVAFSIGCTIAARLTKTAPHLSVGKVVLIGPVTRPMPISPFHWPGIGEYLTGLFLPQAMLNILAGNFQHKTGWKALENVFFDQLRYKGFRRAWLSFYRNLFPKANPGVYNSLRERGIPVCILSGQNDRIVPLQQSKQLHQDTGWPLTVIENGGHAVQYECAERVDSEILTFLGGDAV